MHDVFCKEVKLAVWQYTALTYSFCNFEPVHCSMSGSNCCFLICIQVSQEIGKVFWYFHLRIFQFVVIHTVSLKLCLTLCNPMNCSSWGSSIHGIFQARILEWVAISFFLQGISWPKGQTYIPCIVGRSFITWAIGELVHLDLGHIRKMFLY